MNRKELVAQIAEASQTSQEKANQILQAILDSISKTLKQGGQVHLHRFGKFATFKTKERTFYNLKTKEPFKVKGKNVVRFKCSSVLQEKLGADHLIIPGSHV